MEKQSLQAILPAGLCPATAPQEYSAVQKPTQSVGSSVYGPGTGAMRRAAQLTVAFARSKSGTQREREPPGFAAQPFYLI